MLPLSLVLLALSVGEAEKAGPAEVGTELPIIEDGAGLFQPSAIAENTQRIRAIKKDFGIDLFIETTRERPEATEREKREWFWWRKRKFRNETLDREAHKRADDLKYRRRTWGGIYVLIVEDKAGKREVGVAAFPDSYGADSEVSWVKRDALRETLLSKDATAEDNRRGLDRLVSRFRAQQEMTHAPPPSVLGVESALLVVGGLVGVWLALLFVRWRATQRVEPGDPEPVAIYQPAMMGTLFGLPAAFWVNDELFRALPPEVPPPTRPDSFSLPPMPTLPPPNAVTQGAAEPFTLPPESSAGQEPPTIA